MSESILGEKNPNKERLSGPEMTFSIWISCSIKVSWKAPKIFWKWRRRNNPGSWWKETGTKETHGKRKKPLYLSVRRTQEQFAVVQKGQRGPHLKGPAGFGGKMLLLLLHPIVFPGNRVSAVRLYLNPEGW